MEWRQQGEQIKMDATDVGYDANLHYMYPTLDDSIQQVDIVESADEHFGLIPDDDSIQLQSPEAIALNGLLSDLEFLASTYGSMAERHLENWEGIHNFVTNTPGESIVAYGIYANKAQDIRDLVNRWKPNKK